MKLCSLPGQSRAAGETLQASCAIILVSIGHGAKMMSNNLWITNISLTSFFSPCPMVTPCDIWYRQAVPRQGPDVQGAAYSGPPGENEEHADGVCQGLQ